MIWGNDGAEHTVCRGDVCGRHGMKLVSWDHDGCTYGLWKRGRSGRKVELPVSLCITVLGQVILRKC